MSGGQQYALRVFEPIFIALNDAGVRYVVVGGVAVVLHGHVRVTVDLDLVVDLEPAAAALAIEALTRLGLRPRVPVDALDFADPVQRAGWISEKGMRVLMLHDPADALVEVDVFVESPAPFEELFARSEEVDLGSTSVRIASIDDLIAMKRVAGRPQDLVDIEALQIISEARDGA